MCFNGRRSSPTRGNRNLILAKANYTPQRSPLQITNTGNEIVHNVKDLGVIFNNTLNCSNDIKTICGKTVAMLTSL